MDYNNELKFIDTEEKAYLLGLFYSDGCVSNTNNSCSISLHKNDFYLLKEIVKIFPFFKIKINKNNCNKVICTNKNLKIDLINNGVFPRKSKDNKELLTIKNVPKIFIWDFMRGFFDGDGSVYFRKRNNTIFEISCTSYNLISEIIKLFFDSRIKVNIMVSYAGSGLRTIDCYRIYTSSREECLKFANLIYKNKGNLFLKRKFDLFYREVEVDIKTGPKCPKCDSINTRLSGLNRSKEKQRIYCKNCKKKSTIEKLPLIVEI